MKTKLLILALVLCGCLNALSQATSLTVDCQTPGWLSSMIDYADQQTLENIKVTGYINGTDIIFILTDSIPFAKMNLLQNKNRIVLNPEPDYVVHIHI